jgi:hypothetical protein
MPSAHFLAQNGIGLACDPTVERSAVSDDERVEFTFYVTPEEREAWQAAADQAGLSLEAFVKRAVRRRRRHEKIAERFGIKLGWGWGWWSR